MVASCRDSHYCSQFLTKCQLCMRDFGASSDAQWPRLLPCGHVYCEPCLSSRVDRAQSTLACPFAECPCVVSVEQVTPALPLPKHWAVLDAIAAAAPPVAAFMCTCTVEDAPHPADFHCSKCQVDFCEVNTLLHKRHGGILTPLVTGQGSSARVIPTMCQVDGHAGQELSLYCFTCKKPVCVICGQLTLDNGGHLGHNVNTTAKAKDVCMADLEHASTAANAQARALQQAITEMQAVITQLSAKRSTAELKIDATCNEVRTVGGGQKMGACGRSRRRCDSTCAASTAWLHSCAIKSRPFARAINMKSRRTTTPRSS